MASIFCLVIAGLLLLLLLFVLLVPCEYLIVGEYGGRVSGFVRLKMWPFALRKQLTKKEDVLTEKEGIHVNLKKVKMVEEKFGREKERFGQELTFFLRQERVVWKALLTLICRLWRKTKPRTVRIEGQIGFSEPYYTGLLAGALAAFRLPGVQLQPDFSQSGFCGNILIEGRLHFVSLLTVLGGAILTKPLRSVIWQYLKKKRGGIFGGF